MSALAELLADCEALSIRLTRAGDNGLTIDAPRGALTSDLMDRLKANKDELLAMLADKEARVRSFEPTNAVSVWHAMLNQLASDPLFSNDLMEDLRTASVHWGSGEEATEVADDFIPDTIGPDGWTLGSINPKELTP